MQHPLQLYNTISRKKDQFIPLHSPFVGMYVCGPTVYSDTHLGHARPGITFDLLFRYLTHLQYKVRFVRNITDVGHLENEVDGEGEDRIGKKARLEKLEPMEVVQYYTNRFRQNMAQLNVLPPSIEPQASGHIIEQLQLIDKIVEAGFAYESNGSVYFNVLKYNEQYQYGKLSGRVLDDLMSNTRSLDGQQEKKNSFDFALWKKAEPQHIMHWPSRWGEGFPGWHLECSAMSTKYLGDVFDIHGGGMDLLFPHHECEIAQSTAALGKDSVRFWVHNNMITINGQKMARSLGNFITLNDLFSGNNKLLSQAYSPMTIRFFILQAHYRGTLDFSNEALQGAETGLQKLFTAMKALPQLRANDTSGEYVKYLRERCYEALNDDLNSPALIAHIFDGVRVINSVKDSLKTISPDELDILKEIFQTFVIDILGLVPESTTEAGLTDELIKMLLNLRQEAKAKKDFATSDSIRDELAKIGVTVKDKKDGFDWELNKPMSALNYNNIFELRRRFTSIVNIGDLPLGGNNPIRIQSMTNTLTSNTKATVEQCKRIIDAGGDYVRITTPTISDAENLAEIKKQLRLAGYMNPLIADVHFSPVVAETAARIVEKVRINPGNYVDKKKSTTPEYTDTDTDYQLELEKIHERVLPLLNICKEYGTAIRIGANHGSLSDRIMSRYGDTPEGMAESAMEFLRIFESEGFRQTVVSMKSSNTRVMVQSVRLLVKKMLEEKMQYPLHLGVTEAGEGEDGIIKSAAGIGALLAEGIGETIRVSLSGDPEQEIPVAQNIVKYFTSRQSQNNDGQANSSTEPITGFAKSYASALKNIGGNNVPIVIADWPGSDMFSNTDPACIPDYFFFFDHDTKLNLPVKYKYITSMKRWFVSYQTYPNYYPVYTDSEFVFYGEKSAQLNFVMVSAPDLRPSLFEAIKAAKRTVIIIETFHKNGIAEQRYVLNQLKEYGINLPVIINRNYSEDDKCLFQVKCASDTGPLFIDGHGNGIWVRNAGDLSPSDIVSASFGVLQASRSRTSKTEYISCPSCGRTLFDLTNTIAKIKERTLHLRHLKIGIMGCIVNGPGEMADADYGYVGAGPGRVTLYKNKNIVKRNIPEDMAVDELLALIKENGDWIEP